MTIRITVEAVTAAEAAQLVHDLAGTMASNPDVPANTYVSTIPASAQPTYPQAAPQAPVALPIPQAPITPSYPLQQPGVQFPGQQAAPPPYPGQQPMYPVQQPPVQQQPVQQQMPVPDPTPAVPVAMQSFTMDQLAVAATALIDSGKMGEVQNLLATFGVQALTMLPKEHYGNFATHLRALGAKI